MESLGDGAPFNDPKLVVAGPLWTVLFPFEASVDSEPLRFRVGVLTVKVLGFLFPTRT